MLLLDTHAMLWLDSGAPMREAAKEAIEAAGPEDGVFVSPVSAWEIGMLASKNRLDLDLPPLAWFERFMALPGIRLVPLSAEAAILSSSLPGAFHGDPADRMLVATARSRGMPLVTRDARLLAYAEAGHLEALAC